MAKKIIAMVLVFIGCSVNQIPAVQNRGPTESLEASFMKVAAVFATVAQLYSEYAKRFDTVLSYQVPCGSFSAAYLIASDQVASALALARQMNFNSSSGLYGFECAVRDASMRVDGVISFEKDIGIGIQYRADRIGGRFVKAKDTITTRDGTPLLCVCRDNAARACGEVKSAAERFAQSCASRNKNPMTKQDATNAYVIAAERAAKVFADAVMVYAKAATAACADTLMVKDAAARTTLNMVAAAQAARDAYCFYTSPDILATDVHAMRACCMAYQALYDAEETLKQDALVDELCTHKISSHYLTEKQQHEDRVRYNAETRDFMHKATLQSYKDASAYAQKAAGAYTAMIATLKKQQRK